MSVVIGPVLSDSCSNVRKPHGLTPWGFLVSSALSGATARHLGDEVQDATQGAIEAVRASEASLAAKLAFEFLVLTACRSGEVLSAAWGEIDLEAREWNIPGERMKAKRPHRVTLSGRVLEVLSIARTLAQDGTGLVFSGIKYGKPLSDTTLSKLLRELGHSGGASRVPVELPRLGGGTHRRDARPVRHAQAVQGLSGHDPPRRRRSRERVQARGTGAGLGVLFPLKGGYLTRAQRYK